MVAAFNHHMRRRARRAGIEAADRAQDVDPAEFVGLLELVSRIGVPRLVVIAMKVVRPGKTGQAVGQHTHKLDRTIVRMNLHKNARLTPQVRLLLVRRITEKGWRVADAANAAGISVRQRYRWLSR